LEPPYGHWNWIVRERGEEKNWEVCVGVKSLSQLNCAQIIFLWSSQVNNEDLFSYIFFHKTK
jgi:hypothetical protein